MGYTRMCKNYFIVATGKSRFVHIYSKSFIAGWQVCHCYRSSTSPTSPLQHTFYWSKKRIMRCPTSLFCSSSHGGVQVRLAPVMTALLIMALSTFTSCRAKSFLTVTEACEGHCFDEATCNSITFDHDQDTHQLNGHIVFKGESCCSFEGGTTCEATR